ncbi:uncharacterized protein si:dkey-196h17.9 [Cololabis saira]|uniref:uncharacterized protein si:dkey-196h17.9 n=1 Tax=Cololabis saira TaxID=129043 RepID=UPI002AD504F7|nr:uncharacterized protein si:dkey-196h17.9 [Cololabis saira]
MRAKRWRKPGRSCSTTTLLEENNNNDQQDAGHRYAPPKPPEPPEPHDGAEQQLLQNLLAKSSRMDLRDSNYEKQKLCVDQLIQAFVSQSFPDPPADPDGSLGEHLTHVMEAVVHKLETHGPVISREESRILMDHCHRHTFTHLNTLLQRVNAPRNTFLLMNWVSHTYLGQEMLDNPDQRLLHEWETKAKVKLLESVQVHVWMFLLLNMFYTHFSGIHVRGSLGKVLEVDRAQTHHGEEAYVGLYVDIIQCIGAMTKAAGDISSELHTQVWEVCLRELLVLVRRYTEEQTEALAEETKTWLGNRGNLETIRFLKTLKTCKELRQHVQTGGKGLHTSLLKETVRTLENMEAFTLERLMEIVADMAEVPV